MWLNQDGALGAKLRAARHKRWVKGHCFEITDTDNWFLERNPVPFERGKYVVFGRARNCSIYGKAFTKFIRLDDQRLWCRECIWKILDEDDFGPDVY